MYGTQKLLAVLKNNEEQHKRCINYTDWFAICTCIYSWEVYKWGMKYVQSIARVGTECNIT